MVRCAIGLRFGSFLVEFIVGLSVLLVPDLA